MLGRCDMAFATVCASALEAMAGIADGSSVMVGGFGPSDAPTVVICSFLVPGSTSGEMTAFERLYDAGQIDLELVPQGTLVERIRAAGAGIGAFFTPTRAGTQFADGKETRVIDGQAHVLEYALKADVALIRAHVADEQGNLVYRLWRRNFNPSMATAAALTIAEVGDIVPAGALDPDLVMTPGIFVQRVVRR
jgi:3-oxoadipate CoA-transferase alpha subunit